MEKTIQETAKTGMTIKPSIRTRIKHSTPFVLEETAGAIDFYQVEGLDSMLEVDGAPMIIKPRGKVRFHGADWSPPRMLLRVSRDADGNSINHTHLENVHCTGFSRMQFVNDGSEMSVVFSCQFEQYRPDGSCIVLTNKDRPNLNDATNRQVATNSGHLILASDLSVNAASTVVNKDMGACIRMVGCVTDVHIRDCWFSGQAPAMVLVEEADESGPGWGRWNSPTRIILQDCMVEGEGCKTIYVFCPTHRPEIELQGNSAKNFRIEYR